MDKSKKKKASFATVIFLALILFAGMLFLARKGVPSLGAAALSGDALISPQATPSLPISTFSPVPVVTSTPTVDQVSTAYAVIAYDQATSTAAAAAAGTQYSASQTEQAQQTQAFWVGVTFAVGTQQATETQIAKTEAAGTKQADYQTSVPLTETVVASTQTVESDFLKSKRISIWMTNIGGTTILLALLAVLVFAAYRAVRYFDELGKAKIAQKRIESRKRDEQGHAPLIGTEDLKPGEKIINPDLAHRAVTDPGKDDLNSEQALANTISARMLENTRVIASSSALSEIMKQSAKQAVGQVAPFADIKITKPDEPAEPELPQLTIHGYPELPFPGLEMLSQWDGNMLPFGMDEKAGMMRVDLSSHAHLMYVGRSRSGKSLTGIRTEAACLLTQGWNVIVMGKRVDFMPFDGHPNFKLLAVDVRKDAQKYVDVLKTLTAQMDIRDQLLSSKGISTWARYGADSTMVILDDYSAAMMRMPADKAKEVKSEVAQLAMDGAKFGLSLTIGLQRATWQNIDTNIRSQMARVVYSVESPLDSRVALDNKHGERGAEYLPPFGHFLTRLTDGAMLQNGVAFLLDDESVRSFIGSRPVSMNEPLNWIDSTAQDVEQNLPADVAAAYAADNEEFAIEDKIADIWLNMRDRHEWKGWNYIERQVYGEVKNGARSVKVKKVIALLQSVDVENVNAEIDRLVNSWGTTRSATPQNDDFRPVFIA